MSGVSTILISGIHFLAPGPFFGIFTIPVCLSGFELSLFIFPKKKASSCAPCCAWTTIETFPRFSRYSTRPSVSRLWPKLSTPSHTMPLPPVCHLTLIPEYTGETGSLSSCCNGRGQLTSFQPLVPHGRRSRYTKTFTYSNCDAHFDLPLEFRGHRRIEEVLNVLNSSQNAHR